MSRAKTNLRRLINSNVGQYGKEFTSKFLTLTFADNIQDLNIAHYEFGKFMKRLNYKVFNSKKANLKYNVVVEFQERGAIHYHLIIYNMPYVKQKVLLDIWNNGIVDIRKIDSVDNIGSYVAEYLGSDKKDQGKKEGDSRLNGRKSYFSSRGLLKPIEIIDKKIVETVSAALLNENLTYSAQFSNEHLGDITYKQYNLKTVNRKDVKTFSLITNHT